MVAHALTAIVITRAYLLRPTRKNMLLSAARLFASRLANVTLLKLTALKFPVVKIHAEGKFMKLAMIIGVRTERNLPLLDNLLLRASLQSARQQIKRRSRVK